MGRRNYQARSRRPREFPRIVIFQGFAGRKISLSFHEALHWPTGRGHSRSAAEQHRAVAPYAARRQRGGAARGLRRPVTRTIFVRRSPAGNCGCVR
jgi:hypothetical protein